MLFAFQNFSIYRLLLGSEGEEEQECGPLFSVGCVLAALCPSSHLAGSVESSTEADTGSKSQNNVIRFHLACLLQALRVCGM